MLSFFSIRIFGGGYVQKFNLLINYLNMNEQFERKKKSFIKPLVEKIMIEWNFLD